jgi:UDP-glucose-4-epimerase GalE
MVVLVTGAAGFVGSHFARAAHDAGLAVVALDDLSTNASWPDLPASIERVLGDVGDRFLIEHWIAKRQIDAIVHFAGRIRVEESVREPGLYFEQNLSRTVSLLDAASAVRGDLSFVLSSSAAVYGQPEQSPIIELSSTRPINPYGASKLAAEVVLEAYARSRGVRWAALRYFNAAGAHPDGSLRERHDPETHLIPLAIDAALGRRPPLVVYGDDYATHDGTCVRDYVHVMDLADAHLAALRTLSRGESVGALNLGSECGTTVCEVLAEVARAAGAPVPHDVGPRRDGDPTKLVASAANAAKILGWRPTRNLRTIVEDALRARQG